MPQIEKEYIETGKVKYVVRDFPLESIHRNAFKAGEATHCAADQGKFWEMHARLFANQQTLGGKDLSQSIQAHGLTLGLDLAKFKDCLESGKYAAKIRKDLTDGQRAGVTGTPSFFLGLTEPNGSKVTVLRVLKGAQPYPAIKAAIDSLLAGQK